MGAYIYMLRSPKLIRKVRVRLKDGTEETVEAGVWSYLFKPYRFGYVSPFEPMPRWERLCVAQMTRMEGIWGDSKRPLYTVHVSNLDSHLNDLPPKERNQMKIGDQVMAWEKGAPIWAWDTPCFEGAMDFGTVIELL